jgi:hypothetical protein
MDYMSELIELYDGPFYIMKFGRGLVRLSYDVRNGYSITSHSLQDAARIMLERLDVRIPSAFRRR